jgi:RNA polymerase sigma-B factor
MTKKQNIAVLLKTYNKTHSLKDKEKILTYYVGLVRGIAGKFTYVASEKEDLIQVSNIGLLNSIERYDFSRKVSFETFAVANMIGEIKHYLRDKKRLLKIPRRLDEHYLRIKRFISLYMQVKGGSPTVSVIAQELGLSQENILEALEAGQSSSMVSLDSSVIEDPEKGRSSSVSFLNCLGLIEEGEDNIINKEYLKQLIMELPAMEQKVIYLYFYEDLSQLEMSKKLKISQAHVSRLLKAALTILKIKIKKEHKKNN